MSLATSTAFSLRRGTRLLNVSRLGAFSRLGIRTMQTEAELGEEELEALLSGLMSVPVGKPKSSPSPSVPPPQISDVFSDYLLHQRLDQLQPPPAYSLNAQETLPTVVDLTGNTHYRNELQRLQGEVDAYIASMPSSSTGEVPVPNGIATRDEWSWLFETALQNDDRATAGSVISLMMRCGEDRLDPYIDRLLFAHVFNKDVKSVDRCIKDLRANGVTPTTTQIHLHVDAHAQHGSPYEAQSLIHAYESEHLLPMEATYRNLIKTLIDTPIISSDAPKNRALAWDLFYHMRYIAHPKPSVDTYATMIRAAASAAAPSAERALDLLYEMTKEHGLQADTATYNSVMLTCARSRDKNFVQQTFRLGRQLITDFRDTKADAVRPDLQTFKAMMEAAMRLGDVARARWILAELVRMKERVDDELMGHVFHAYAAYKVPELQLKITKATKVKSEDKPATPEVQAGLPEPHVSVAPSVPRSAAEVIKEADVLFSRIQTASSLAESVETDVSHPEWTFTSVKITSSLVNAYMAVRCNHGSPQDVASKFVDAYQSLGVSQNSQSYVTVFGALIAKGQDRSAALTAADSLWKNWLSFSSRAEKMAKKDVRLSPRKVEEVWSKMIRIATMAGQHQRAMELARQFVTRYPPNSIIPSKSTTLPAVLSASLPKQSFPTRVSLEAPQPLVRLTTNLQIPDDIPPFLAFRDIAVLHKALVVRLDGAAPAVKQQLKKDLAFLTWMCHSYSGRLGRRRELKISQA